MADDCMTYRITVKEYAMKYGWHATFMPKPLFGENGSGHAHAHVAVQATAATRSSTPTTTYFLSDIGKAFIAGQLRHAREISSIFAQWVNSYKRLVPGYEAPVVRGLVAAQPLARSCACRSTTRARSRRRAWSCAARTPRATRT